MIIAIIIVISSSQLSLLSSSRHLKCHYYGHLIITIAVIMVIYTTGAKGSVSSPLETFKDASAPMVASDQGLGGPQIENIIFFDLKRCLKTLQD